MQDPFLAVTLCGLLVSVVSAAWEAAMALPLQPCVTVGRP